MSDRILIDTNLWVYLYAHHPEAKYRKVRQLVQDNFESIILSPQVLGELYHVLTRKNLCSREKSKRIVIQTVDTFPICHTLYSEDMQHNQIIENKIRNTNKKSFLKVKNLTNFSAAKPPLETLAKRNAWHTQLRSNSWTS